MFIRSPRRRGYAPSLLCAAAGCVFGLSAHAGPTLVDWIGSTDGDWFEPSRWSGGVVPNNDGGATYAARLGGASPYTVTLEAAVTISTLEFAVASTLSVGPAGSLSVADSLALNDGTLRLRGGSVTGGTWTGAGGTVRFDENSALNNATLAGALTMLGASPSALIDLQDVTLANGADVRMGSDSEVFAVRGGLTVTGGAMLRSGGLVNGSLLRHTRTHLLDGAVFTVENGGLLSFASPGIIAGDGSGLFRNEGTLNIGTPPPPAALTSIDSSSTAQRLVIESSAGRFENSGLLNVAAAGQTLIEAQFSNSGQVDLYAGTLTLAGAWENTGSINLIGSGASLVLGGSFATSSTEGITRTLGSIFLDGVMDNAGATTTLQTGLTRWTARGAVIEGGTIDGRLSASQRAIVGEATIRDVTLLTANSWNLFATDRVTLERTTLPNTMFIGLNDAAFLTFGDAQLPDGIRVDAYSNSGLQFAGGDHTVRGADLRLFSGADIRVMQGASLTLDSESEVTISGLGSVFLVGGGFGANRFTNEGYIQATNIGAATVVDIGGGASEFINRGSIVHAGRGTFRVSAVTNEQAGSITALNEVDSFQFTGGLTNHGTVLAIDTSTSITGDLFNTGSISIVGGDLDINSASTSAAISNLGSITVTNGSLTLGGAYSFADLGTLSVSGAVRAAGIIRNASETLDLGALGSSWTFNGRVEDGAVRFGATATRAGIETLTLSGVSVLDDAFGVRAGETLVFENSALMSGAAVQAATGSEIRLHSGHIADASFHSVAAMGSPAPSFYAGQGTSFAGDVLFEGAWDIDARYFSGAGNFEMSGGGTLDIAGQNDGTMRFTGGTTSLLVTHPSSAFTTTGEIVIDDGATLILDREGFNPTGNIVNLGTTRIESGGTLFIDRHLSTSSLGTLHNAGRITTSEITLTNTGQNLRQVGQGVIEMNGLLDGGSLDLGGGSLEFSRTVRDVMIENGDVVTTGGFANWQGNTSLRNGALRLASNLLVESTSFDADEVRLNGWSITFDEVHEIASTTTIRGGGTLFSRFTAGAPTIVNRGTITNDEAETTLRFSGAFVNEGVIRAANGALVTLNDSGTLTNRGVIEANSAAFLDLTWLLPEGADNAVGTVLANDSVVRWRHRGPFTGLVDLNASVLELTQSLLAPSDFAAYDLDDASSFRLDRSTLDLGGSTYAFERPLEVIRAEFRNGLIATPNALEGQMTLTFINAGIAEGDLIFTGDSSIASAGDHTLNGLTRNRGGSLLIALDAVGAFGDDIVNESGTLGLVGSTIHGAAVVNGDIHIESGAVEIVGYQSSPLRVQTAGLVSLGSTGGAPTTLTSNGSILSVLGTLTLSSGAVAQFDSISAFQHELGNLVPSTNTLANGRFIIDNATLDLGDNITIATNNSDVELRGAAQFDALTQGIAVNSGRLTLADGFDLQTPDSLANTGSLIVQNSSLVSGQLINVGRLSIEGDSNIVADSLLFVSSSSVDITITEDTAPAAILSTIGDASLAGTLSLAVAQTAGAAWGDSYEIMQIAGARTGVFATITGPDAADGLAWETEWVGNSLYLRARDWADLNDDGVIDFSDLNSVLGQYGSTGMSVADIDGDGVVGFSDLNIVLARYGATIPRAVPGPATSLIVLTVGMCSLRRRKRGVGHASPPNVSRARV